MTDTKERLRETDPKRIADGLRALVKFEAHRLDRNMMLWMEDAAAALSSPSDDYDAGIEAAKLLDNLYEAVELLNNLYELCQRNGVKGDCFDAAGSFLSNVHYEEQP